MTYHFNMLTKGVILVSCFLFLAGCEEDEGDGDGTWLYHKGGVVCVGTDAVPVPGTEIYVAPDGDDNNAGTSPQEAFATLAQALCNVAPGQTVHVALGTYNESVLLSRFGEKNTPIHIIGEKGPEGELPILDGGQHFTYGIAIIGEDEDNKSYGFIIENLEFRNYTDAGLLAVLSENIEIRNCILRENGFHGANPENAGEGFGADLIEIIDLVVDSVEAMGNGPETEVWQKGILGNDIAIWGSQNVEVRNCYTHDGIGGGLLVEDCIDVLVENNRFNDATLSAPYDELDGAIWVDGGHDILVRNNIIDNNRGPGLQISDEGVQHPYGYVFQGNTISNNDLGVYIWNFGVCPWPDTSIVKMIDNTFINNTEGDSKCEEWPCGEGKPCD